jgi:hypothetical protein
VGGGCVIYAVMDRSVMYRLTWQGLLSSELREMPAACIWKMYLIDRSTKIRLVDCCAITQTIAVLLVTKWYRCTMEQ